MYGCTWSLLGGELKWVASGVSDLKLLKNLANLINFRNRQDDVTPVDNYFFLEHCKILQSEIILQEDKNPIDGSIANFKL